MRSRSRDVRNMVVMCVIAGPHTFGCATLDRGTWEVTRPVNDLVPPGKVRSMCGGADACAALCEDIRSNLFEEPFRDFCVTPDNRDSSQIVGCEPRGRELLITCEWEDEQKGCMPDS